MNYYPMKNWKKLSRNMSENIQEAIKNEVKNEKKARWRKTNREVTNDSEDETCNGSIYDNGVIFGFVKYHGMTAEQFIWAWIKSEILMPKKLVFRSENLYLMQ